MITEKDFNIEFPRNYDELRGLEEKIEQLLKERDAALEKAEAYREVAIKAKPRSKDPFAIPDEQYSGMKVDQEAAAILERRKGER